MTPLLYTTFSITKMMVLLPITYFAVPIVRFWWLIIKHTVFYPALLMFRTFLFTFVYLPLMPLLNTAKIHYDSNVPVEISLYRLVIMLHPHVTFLVINLIHYLMISLFMGSTVGVIAGFNLSLVSKIFNMSSEPKKSARYTQTTPYVDSVTNRANLAKKVPNKELDLLKLRLKKQTISVPTVLNMKTSGETIHKNRAVVKLEAKSAQRADSDPETNSKQNTRAELIQAQPSVPTIKLEPSRGLIPDPFSISSVSDVASVSGSTVSSVPGFLVDCKLLDSQKMSRFPSGKPLIDFKTTKPDSLEVLRRQVFEDDDGYSLLDYGDQGLESISKSPTSSAKDRRQRERRPVENRFLGSSKPTLVDVIIEEETDRETSPVLSAKPFESLMFTTKSGLDNLSTLVSSADIVFDDKPEADVPNSSDILSEVTAHSSDLESKNA